VASTPFHRGGRRQLAAVSHARITHVTNNIRIVLWMALALVLWLNYNVWVQDHGTRSGVNAVIGSQTSRGVELPNRVPVVPRSQSSPSVTAPPAAQAPNPVTPAPVIHVRTDVLDLELSTRGGTIQRADLMHYPKVKGEPTPVRLENTDSPETLYELQTGLSDSDVSSYPTHLAKFTSSRTDYRIDGAPELRVPLTWTNDKGVSVTKTYIFQRGQYRIGLEYTIENHGDSPWDTEPYAQILRNEPRIKSSMFDIESRQFHGPAYYDGTKYHKLDISKAEDSHLDHDVRDGWIAATQHYFVTAVIPPKQEQYHISLRVNADEYLLVARGAVTTVHPGTRVTIDQTLYIGPKLQAQLKATGSNLDLVADYGVLTLLARPLFWLLAEVHALTGNWGVAIIVVTMLLKLLFYPLSETSGRSMAKMKALGPRIKNLQETYKDDRQKQGRAIMDLYQREKVNPLTGCLPMIIQIPVFLAFYWVLLASVEMRQAPFVLWIQDLSSRDPYFVLPAIMAAAMFAQYRLNPAPADPVQAKVFMFMPLAMSTTFAFFPAGLVLYWVTNTILAIAQQWNINRRIAAATRKH
jgi:YidC/Oxa1 family membrane protein insertase